MSSKHCGRGNKEKAPQKKKEKAGTELETVAKGLVNRRLGFLSKAGTELGTVGEDLVNLNWDF